ncbi:uncharacterized protein [Montipora capricornis]|uniref:uncharacterized protein n=1 Tax=Montipora capricornis TaxID=246305 RepID=UPI0035F14136
MRMLVVKFMASMFLFMASFFMMQAIFPELTSKFSTVPTSSPAMMKPSNVHLLEERQRERQNHLQKYCNSHNFNDTSRNVDHKKLKFFMRWKYAALQTLFT